LGRDFHRWRVWLEEEDGKEGGDVDRWGHLARERKAGAVSSVATRIEGHILCGPAGGLLGRPACGGVNGLWPKS